MADPPRKNLLCYGDNLVFLTDTDLFPNESVDLIYLDPPFNSQQSYNVLFKELTGAPEAAQIKAFEDTWTWWHGGRRPFPPQRETSPCQVSRGLRRKEL